MRRSLVLHSGAMADEPGQPGGVPGKVALGRLSAQMGSALAAAARPQQAEPPPAEPQPAPPPPAPPVAPAVEPPPEPPPAVVAPEPVVAQPPEQEVGSAPVEPEPAPPVTAPPTPVGLSREQIVALLERLDPDARGYFQHRGLNIETVDESQLIDVLNRGGTHAMGQNNRLAAIARGEEPPPDAAPEPPQAPQAESAPPDGTQAPPAEPIQPAAIDPAMADQRLGTRMQEDHDVQSMLANWRTAERDLAAIVGNEAQPGPLLKAESSAQKFRDWLEMPDVDEFKKQDYQNSLDRAEREIERLEARQERIQSRQRELDRDYRAAFNGHREGVAQELHQEATEQARRTDNNNRWTQARQELLVSWWPALDRAMAAKNIPRELRPQFHELAKAEATAKYQQGLRPESLDAFMVERADNLLGMVDQFHRVQSAQYGQAAAARTGAVAPAPPAQPVAQVDPNAPAPDGDNRPLNPRRASRQAGARMRELVTGGGGV